MLRLRAVLRGHGRLLGSILLRRYRSDVLRRAGRLRVDRRHGRLLWCSSGSRGSARCGRNRRLCGEAGRRDRGTCPVVMPENYITMFATPTREAACKIIEKAEMKIMQAAAVIRSGEEFAEPDITITDRLISGIVNDLFYPVCVHAKKFYVTDACISCGKCERVCPTQNVHLESGRPVWGKKCTHCMACICRCPAEAIEYGKHSRGLPRYTFPESEK